MNTFTHPISGKTVHFADVDPNEIWALGQPGITLYYMRAVSRILKVTRRQLVETMDELSDTQDQLSDAQAQLAATRARLAMTQAQLGATAEQLSEWESTRADTPPSVFSASMLRAPMPSYNCLDPQLADGDADGESSGSPDIRPYSDLTFGKEEESSDDGSLWSVGSNGSRRCVRPSPGSPVGSRSDSDNESDDGEPAPGEDGYVEYCMYHEYLLYAQALPYGVEFTYDQYCESYEGKVAQAKLLAEHQAATGASSSTPPNRVFPTVEYTEEEKAAQAAELLSEIVHSEFGEFARFLARFANGEMFDPMSKSITITDPAIAPVGKYRPYGTKCYHTTKHYPYRITAVDFVHEDHILSLCGGSTEPVPTIRMIPRFRVFEGEICEVRMPYLIKGYLTPRPARRPKWTRSGDLDYYKNDGLDFTGTIDGFEFPEFYQTFYRGAPIGDYA